MRKMIECPEDASTQICDREGKITEASASGSSNRVTLEWPLNGEARIGNAPYGDVRTTAFWRIDVLSQCGELDSRRNAT